MKKGQELTLEVTDIAFGGRGLAKPDGFAVFVTPVRPVPEDASWYETTWRAWREGEVFA